MFQRHFSEMNEATQRKCCGVFAGFEGCLFFFGDGLGFLLIVLECSFAFFCWFWSLWLAKTPSLRTFRRIIETSKVIQTRSDHSDRAWTEGKKDEDGVSLNPWLFA